MPKLKISFLVLAALLLSACQIPFTDKDLKIPFISGDPQETINSALADLAAAKQGRVKTKLKIKIDHSFDMAAVNSRLNDASGKLSLLLNPYQPAVLGIDSSEMRFDPFGMSGGTGLKMDIDMDSRYDLSDEDMIKGELDIDVDLDIGNIIIKSGASIKNIGQKLFLKVNKVPDMLAAFLPSSYFNKWWLIDMDRLEEIAKESSDLAALGFLESIEKRSDESFAQRLVEYAQSEDLLLFTEKLENQSVNGEDSYRYKASLNTEHLIGFYKMIMTELGQDLPSDLNDIIGAIDLKADLLLYIGKKSNILHQVEYDISATIDSSRVKDNPLAGMDMILNFRITGQSNYSEMGQPQDIRAPEAESLTDLLLKQIKEANIIKQDSEMWLDVRAIQSGLKSYYTKNNAYPSRLSEISPDHLTALPQASAIAHADCPRGNYFYEQTEDGKSYELTYCLNNSRGEIGAGRNIAAPDGINAGNPEIRLLRDSDGDGLNDYEEINIYKSDPQNPDSNNNGISDGDEVRSWRDPAGAGVLPAPFSTPYGAVIAVQKIRDPDLFWSKAIMSEDHISDEFGLTLPEFEFLFKALTQSELYKDKVDIINITSIKEIRDDLVRVAYRVNYAGDTKARDDFDYMRQVGEEWWVSLADKLKELKETDPHAAFKTKQTYSKQQHEDILRLMNQDTDSDGLSDFEEKYIYSTSIWNPDTDGDGYSDGDEVRNGYNPLGPGPLPEHLPRL